MGGTVSASWVRLHELCLRYLNSLGIVFFSDHARWTCSILPSRTSKSVSVYCHSGIPNLLNRWSPPLRRDRDFDGLVDELQLLGFQALSEPSAPVVSQRLVCHGCCSRAASVESPQCPVDCHHAHDVRAEFQALLLSSSECSRCTDFRHVGLDTVAFRRR